MVDTQYIQDKHPMDTRRRARDTHPHQVAILLQEGTTLLPVYRREVHREAATPPRGREVTDHRPQAREDTGNHLRAREDMDNHLRAREGMDLHLRATDHPHQVREDMDKHPISRADISDSSHPHKVDTMAPHLVNNRPELHLQAKFHRRDKPHHHLVKEGIQHIRHHRSRVQCLSASTSFC